MRPFLLGEMPSYDTAGENHLPYSKDRLLEEPILAVGEIGQIDNLKQAGIYAWRCAVLREMFDCRVAMGDYDEQCNRRCDKLVT